MSSVESIVTVTNEPRERKNKSKEVQVTLFTLDDDFLKQYIGKQPKWGPVGYVTYKRTYARSLNTINKRHQELATANGLKTSEEWWLTVCRVVEGTYQIQQRHCKTLNLRWQPSKAQASAQEMYDLIFNFKFTPPGRGLWMMGTPYVEKVGGASLNNCAFVSTEDIDVAFSEPFTFLMDVSMLGVGVGFDTKGAGKLIIQNPVQGNDVHVVEDSREGWVDLLGRVLDAFVGKATLPKTVDYSKLRLYGALIQGFGGTSSGPEPLIELVDFLIAFLTKRVGSFLESTDIVDIANVIGRCVVAGNVRRSAELSLGEPSDRDFLNLKNKKLHPDACANWRWASNNSILATVGMDYTEVSKLTATNGEPGYVWLDNARKYGRMGRDPDFKDMAVKGVNPCSEQSLESYELCCLAEVFPSNHDSYEELERTLKFVYLYAKTVTLVPTHIPQTNAVMLRNRRIGVSMTGIVQAIAKFGRREFFSMCDRGYEHIKRRDEQYSRWLCVPMSNKRTSVKPSGSVSKLAGVPSGIHHPHSEYYYQVIRFAADSPLMFKFKAAGYTCYDLAQAEPNTVAVYFPVHEEHFDRAKDDVSIWEQVELACQMQQYWADNQVSITVTFSEAEAKDLKYVLEYCETRVKGISFLPAREHGYSHPPLQKITKEVYDEYVAKLLPVEIGETTNEVQDKFCEGDSCLLPR